METIDLSSGTITITIEPSTDPHEELEIASAQEATHTIAAKVPKLSDLLDWQHLWSACTFISKSLFGRLADSGHLIINHPVKSLMTLMGFASILASIVALAPVFEGQIVSEEGLELAKWTAWKDFREQCQEAKKEAAVSQDCEEAIRTPLPPPPHVNIHIRRVLEVHNDITMLPNYVHVALSVGAILVASLSAVLLCHRIQMDHRLKSLASHRISSFEELVGSDGPVQKSLTEMKTKKKKKKKKQQKPKPEDAVCTKCEDLEDKLAAALEDQEGWKDMQEKLTAAQRQLRAYRTEHEADSQRSFETTATYHSPQRSTSQQRARKRRGYAGAEIQQYGNPVFYYSSPRRRSGSFSEHAFQDEADAATAFAYGRAPEQAYLPYGPSPTVEVAKGHSRRRPSAVSSRPQSYYYQTTIHQNYRGTDHFSPYEYLASSFPRPQSAMGHRRRDRDQATSSAIERRM